MKAFMIGFEQPKKEWAETVLNAPATGKNDRKYRWVLLPNGFFPKYGGNYPILQVQQQHKTGDWSPCGGGWRLESLVNGDDWSSPCTSDTIAIDFGQDWYVSGIQGAIAEAMQLTGLQRK